jgi:hypothetical protein
MASENEGGSILIPRETDEFATKEYWNQFFEQRGE